MDAVLIGTKAIQPSFELRILLVHESFRKLRTNWNWKGSSYPLSGVSVHESEAATGVGGPAGGKAGPRAADRIRACPPPVISTWSVRCETLITSVCVESWTLVARA